MTIKTIFRAGLAVLVFAGLSGVAEAKRGHRPYVEFEDFPFGEHCMRIGSHLHCSGANFGHPGFRHPHDPGYAFTHRLSCGEAKSRVRARGFNKIVTKDCSGKSYSFSAIKKGNRYLVKVNAHTGRVKVYGL
jgi:hypothetical protein